MAIFGDTTAGGSTFPTNGDRGVASKFTLSEDGDVTQINVRFHSSSGAGTSVKGIIYADDAGGSVPGSLLIVGAAASVPGGGGDIASSATGNLSAGSYWVGGVTNSFEALFECDGSGVLSHDGNLGYASPASTWGEDSTGTQLNAYVTYTPSSGLAWIRA
jgi:hypothetical protein